MLSLSKQGTALFILLAFCYLTDHVCTADDTMVNCTLCPNPNATLGIPDGILTTGQEVLTCASIQDRGILVLPEQNCTSLQTFGERLCLCDQEPPEINNNCTLCEDGSPLKQPLLEGLPGEICAVLQIDAIRDDSDNCGAHQATVGVYCLCDNPVASGSACRFCGGAQLLDHLQIINETKLSCGELELQATLDPTKCSSFQGLYGDECCRDLPPPTLSPTSRALTIVGWTMPSMATVIVLWLIF